MRINTIALLMLLLSINSSQAQMRFEAVENITGGNITEIFYTGESEITVFSNEGLIFRTTDDGETWKTVDIVFEGTQGYSPRQIGNTIFVPTLVGTKSKLYRSIDGGETWSIVYEGEGGVHIFSALEMISEEKVWISGVKGSSAFLQKSEDAGETWETITLPAGTLPSLNILFLNDSEGYITDQDNTVLKTTDGGATWETMSTFPQGFFRFKISTDQNWVGLGTGGKLYQSTDAGATWTNVLSNIQDFEIVNDSITIAVGNQSSRFYITKNQFTDFTSINLPTAQGTYIGGVTVVNDSTFLGSGSVLYKTTDSGATWNSISKKNLPNLKVETISWVNDSTGFIVGSNGTYKTRNGGANWVEQSSVGFRPVHTHFADELHGFDTGASASEGNGNLYRTINGGITWENITHPYNLDVNALYFQTGAKGWMMGRSGLFVESTDSGKTWSDVSSSLPQEIQGKELYSMHFSTENHGVIGGNQGYIAFTNDGGNTWSSSKVGSFGNDLDIVYRIGEQVIWALEHAGAWVSNDAGANWTKTSAIDAFTTGNDWSGISFINEDIGIIGSSNYLYATTDGGETFEVITAPAKNTIMSGLHLQKDGSGFLYAGSLVLFYDESLATSIETESSLSNPSSISLQQNYPNPFNPTTQIGFQLPANGMVSLKVYNLIGQEVASLIDARMNAGTHTVNFDATGLSSGIYIYRLQSGSFSQVKKMLLIK